MDLLDDVILAGIIADAPAGAVIVLCSIPVGCPQKVITRAVGSQDGIYRGAGTRCETGNFIGGYDLVGIGANTGQPQVAFQDRGVARGFIFAVVHQGDLGGRAPHVAKDRGRKRHLGHMHVNRRPAGTVDERVNLVLNPFLQVLHIDDENAAVVGNCLGAVDGVLVRVKGEVSGAAGMVIFLDHRADSHGR